MNYDDGERRSTAREFDRSMWAGTHVTASSGGRTQLLPSSSPTAHNSNNKDSINYAEHEPPFCILVSTSPSTAPLSNKVLLTQCWKHVKLSLASSNQLLL